MRQPGDPTPSAPTRRHRDRRFVIAAIAAAGVIASVGTFAIAERDPAITITSIPAAADTYVVQQYPRAVNGTAPKLTAAHLRNWTTEAYVRFVVPDGDRHVVSARVELTFLRLGHRPEQLRLHRLTARGWSEEATNFRNKPKIGEEVADGRLSADSVSFDVTEMVREPGVYAFGLTNPDPRTVAAVASRESADGPRLVVGTLPGKPGDPRPPVTKPPTPTPTATAKPTPTGEPTRPAPPPPPPAPPAPPDSSTLCGASFNSEQPGESYQEALARIDDSYNGLEMIRVFYPGKPAPWPGKVNVKGRPMVVSFKFPPAQVVAGTHDAYMRTWFATAPRDQDVYWSYWHEPEDDITRGAMTPAQYRAAWKHLRALADQARNDRLTATLVLMGFTLAPASRRNFADYYAGRDVIQSLGWDVYNPGEEKGMYQDPAVMYRRVVERSQAEELPFGIAETGSYLIRGDDAGTGRAGWLRSLARYLSSEGALWVSYFDLKWPSGDFRLRDQASMKAWREFCS